MGPGAHQCFYFSRNLGYVTPKIIYFRYLKLSSLDQSVQKTVSLILKTEALEPTLRVAWNRQDNSIDLAYLGVTRRNPVGAMLGPEPRADRPRKDKLRSLHKD